MSAVEQKRSLARIACRWFAAFATFLGGFHEIEVNGVDGFWLMADDLGLRGQTNWNYYNALDAPEGSYMGWLWAGKTNLDGVLNLKRTLAPGRYYVMLKVIDYMGQGRIGIGMGQGYTVVDTINGDWNKYWTTNAAITVAQPVSNITVRLIKTLPDVNGVQKYLLRGIYITTNVNENVPLYGFDRIVNYSNDRRLNLATPKTGNLLQNASFEVGLGQGWSFLADGYERDKSIQSLWVTNSATNSALHGTACLLFPYRGCLESRIYRVKPNTRYTLSAWARADSPTGIAMGIRNVATPPSGFPNVVNVNDNGLRIGPLWQRISVSANLLGYPHSDYRISIYGNPGTYFDAIQLEEGDATPFACGTAVELGFLCETPGRVLFEDEKVALNIAAFNSSTQAFTGTMVYEIYDIYNRKISSGEKLLSLAALSRVIEPLTLPTKRGIFRIVGWIRDAGNTLEETSYAVVPRPRVLGVDETSIIGIHPNMVPFQLDVLQRMGIKWARAMSPEGIFRWAAVEPVEGQMIWHDIKVDRCKPRGISILATIGTNFEWPKWADTNGLPNLEKWESYVERLVTHYQDRVKYWEIWNEPVYVFTPEFYAQLLKRASVAIRRADPSAKIVGMGGVYKKDWILEVMDHLGSDWRQYVDYISTHLYPYGMEPSGGETEERAVGFKRDVIDRYGVEVWNTETGVWDEGFYKTANSDFSLMGEPIWPHLDSQRYVSGCFYQAERMLDNFVHCVGNGLSKYFYYDSRIQSPTTLERSDVTILEYDDSIRPKGIAYSIAAWFLDGSRGLGSVGSNATTYAYLFERAGRATVVIWSKDKLNHSLQLTGADWRAFDMMGNELSVPRASVPFGRTPVYVQSATLTLEAVRAAFQTATLSNCVDSIPPNLSVDEFPTGPTPSRNVIVRWLGIDDTSIPSASEPNAVTYSYRLEGRDSGWSDWTPATYVSLASLAPGNYTFFVRARDAAGNVSVPVSRVFKVQSPLMGPSVLRAQ